MRTLRGLGALRLIAFPRESTAEAQRGTQSCIDTAV